MKRLFLFLFLVLPIINFAKGNLDEQRKIIFPDVPGYLTLKCDFHTHTAFSDGHVWPTVRVWEALKDNLDAIAVTDHLEYQPHKDDIPNLNRNRAYEIEVKTAKEKDLIVIKGSEITRSMPPGHCNAIFLDDVNKLLVDEPIDAFKEAKEQNAFAFWNHPFWTAQREDGIATLTEMHKQLIADGLIQGIEVVNDYNYSDEALQIALDYNLTLMGNSDIHDLIDWVYNVPEGGHRPVTLVFAKEKTKASLKDALMNRRTVVNIDNSLIGRPEYLLPLLESSITFVDAEYEENASVLRVTLKNNTNIEFTLQNKSKFTLHANSDVFMIEPMSEIVLEVKTIDKLLDTELKFEVLNAVTAPSTHPELVVGIEVE